MDEFSDFQMAVQLPNPKVVSMGIPPPLFSNNHGAFPHKQQGKNLSAGRFPSDSSPVHSIASHTSKSDLVHSQTASSHSVASCSPAINKFGASVGSRLANYDLGFSGPQPQTNGFQTNLEFPLNASSANTPKTINDLSNNYHHHHHQQQQQPSFPIPRSNQDLLIGEEDKYSALRLLIETDINSCSSSVFEKPSVDAAGTTTPTPNLPKTETVKSKPVQNGNSLCNGTSNVNSAASSTALFDLNVSNSINSNNSMVVNSNNLMGALDFPSMNASNAEPSSSFGEASAAAVADSSDFGDFQSFTGFTPVSANPPSSNSSVFPPSSNSFMGNFQSQHLPAPLSQFPNFAASQKPVKFDFFEPVTTAPPPLQNGNSESDDGDTEFGDFVSVEPVIPEVQQDTKLPPVPAAAPLPTFSRWNKHLDLSPLTLVKQTPPPLPTALQEDKENIEDIMDIGGYFSKYTSPLENDLSASPQKSQQQPPPTQTANDIEDDFDTFSGFKSSTNFHNNIISNSNSDQDKSNVDCSPPKTNQVNFPPSTLSSSSTFIRTSLIRNDKVTDIDPVKWNQTVEESNNELDYSSFERKDFTSSGGGKSKFLDVSPETRSIASLDLGNYVSVDYSDTGTMNNNINHNNNNNNNIYSPVVPSQSNHQQNHNGSKSGSSVIPGALPFHKGTVLPEEQSIYDEYDKYQCFREECESEQERYCSEWSRCLFACKEIISKAFTVFNGVSTSEVLREVVADEKGYSYVMNILEIYRISLRIRKSAGKLGAQSKLESMNAEITNLWETLSAFLLGTCVSGEISQENVDRGDCCGDDGSSPEDLLPSCGVCLCTVNTTESSQFLDYGGKIYHCKCANFWINEVDAILPSLSYVSNNVGSSSGNNNIAGSTAVNSFHVSSKNQLKFNRTNSLV